MLRPLANWLSRNTAWVALLLYLVALALRMFYYSHLGNTLMADVLLMDEAYYQNEARNILLGVPQPTDSWFMTPLYPYFLSAVFWVHDTPMAAYLLQMILGASLAPMGYLLGRKITSSLWAMVAGLAIATFAPLIFFEGLLLVESLVTVSLTGSILCALYSGRSWRLALLAGLLLGIAILGRGSNLVLAPVWLLWLFTRRPHFPTGNRRQPWTGFVLGCLVPLTPLLLYNATHAQQPLLLTANGGFNLYLGNGPQATGFFQLPADLDLVQDPLALRYVQRRLHRRVTASEAQQFWLQRTWSHVQQHPGQALQLLAWKNLLFWNRTSFPQVESFETAVVDLPLSRFPFWRNLLLLPMALLGILIVLLQRRHAQAGARRLVAGSVLLYAASIALFFITDRYRMAILPLTILLAVIPLETAASAWLPGKRRRLLLLLGALAVLTFLTAADRLAIDHVRMRRDIHVHDALRFTKAERYDKAVSEYRQALLLTPEDPQIIDGLARLYARSGEDSLAVTLLRGLLQEHPQNARSWYNLGNQYRRLQRHQEAVEAYQQSLAVEPQREAAWNNMGESFRALGDTASAAHAYRQAISVVPGHVQAWNNLGALRATQGDASASEAAFRQAIAANPRYIPAWTNLAILLTNQGRYEEALLAWRNILALEPDNPLAKNTVQRIQAARGEPK